VQIEANDGAKQGASREQQCALRTGEEIIDKGEHTERNATTRAEKVRTPVSTRTIVPSPRGSDD
jgi:hypothetical protein